MGAPEEARRCLRAGHRDISRTLVVIGAAAGCCFFLLTPVAAWSQEQQVIVQSASGPVAVPAGATPGPGGPAQTTPNGAQPGGQPATTTPGDQAGTDKEKEKDKAAEEQTTVKRPSKPAQAPDPREFDVKPDENQRLSFNFHGQVWPHVLQWLASIGGHSLDWQELPDDYIHVSSGGEKSVAEVRDLFNQLLFERGFTLILKDKLLLVVKLDKLDPSLLPRVEDESELLDLPAHDFVKITFRLPEELKADKAAEDVKPLLSRSAKVQPLMATNRLLVIDIVANLREVSHLLNTEHAAATGRIVPREFPLRFARADYVADQVMILLGLDPSSRRTPQELQVEQQRLQLFTQMQQQGKDITKYLRGDNAPVVFLAVNDRNNSLLANAPPKDMALIERAVNLLDIPGGMLAGAGTAPLSMKRYSLITIKPESIISALTDIGDLDPRSQVKIDSDAKVVFANATSEDHEKIQAMIDQLDGTGRQFDVIWLRRLPAEAVAKTIHNLMVGQEEKKDENPRRYIFYGFPDNNQEKESPNQGFRIEADTANNRLLLWANEGELKEVRALLVKLGELPGESGNPHTVRAFHAGDEESAERLLEQLRRLWPSIQANPLQIETPAPDESVPGDRNPEPQIPPVIEKTDGQREARLLPSSADSVQDARPLTSTAANDLTAARSEQIKSGQAAAQETALAWADPTDHPGSLRPAETDAVAAGATAPTGASTTAPIQISVDRDGRLLLRSSDTRALDQLEELIDRIAPPRKDFEVFYLKHASASLVTINLEDYFEEDSKDGNSSEDAWWAGWYGYGLNGNTDSSASGDGGLSQRKPLRFIWDFDTNSILVSNATPDQLSTIRSLIEIYDRPISEDSISARRFQIFKIQHARATDVAATIKDVYRDLLSSKDKVFERNNGEQKEQSSQSTNYIRVFGSVEDTEKKPTKVKASFAGALSVGIDEVSNTVIISAQEEWMPSISEMIRYLDVAAEPYGNTVQVVHTNVSGKSLQAALSRVVGGATEASPPKEPEQKPPAEAPPKEAAAKPASAATPSTSQ